jgi:glycine/betaine/sarcosine/D-proline reductase family selenoprotein B
VERAGIPTVVITNLVTIAEQVGAPRIVQGRGIPYPVGDPDVPLQAERAWRRRLVMRCLEALATPVEQPTVFQVDTAPKEAADA